jgi:kynureninase
VPQLAAAAAAVSAERLCTEVAHQLPTAIVVVFATCAADLLAAEACQGVPQLLGLHHWGVDYGWACHKRLIVVGPGERVGAAQVWYAAVGNVVVVASGLVEAHTGAVLRWEEEGNAVADAREVRLVVVGRIGRLAEARSTAVDPVVVGLPRVRLGLKVG